MLRRIGTSVSTSAAVVAIGATPLVGTSLRFQHNKSPESVNMYNSKAYSRNRLNTRVVVKEKPPVKSARQRLWDYMKPSLHGGDEHLDTLQVLKFLGYLTLPVIVLVVWKRWMIKLPDQWEQQVAGLQVREMREKDVDAKELSYFQVIEGLEEKRQKAIERHESKKKGNNNSSAATPATSS